MGYVTLNQKIYLSLQSRNEVSISILPDRTCLLICNYPALYEGSVGPVATAVDVVCVYPPGGYKNGNEVFFGLKLVV